MPRQRAQSPEALAESYKSRGNDAFGRGRYLEAEELYSSAAEVGHALPQRAVYLANRAAARLHLGRYADAAEDCSAALEADPVYVKVCCTRDRRMGWHSILHAADTHAPCLYATLAHTRRR